MATSLWPADFGVVDQQTPVGILREQAQALGARTANIVIGRVSTVATANGKIRHILSLWCSPLQYSIGLLWIDHGLDLYPVEIFIEGEAGPSAIVESEAEFQEKLKEVFAREKTRKTIASLIAQSKQ